MKLKSLIVGAVLATSVAAGTAACSVGGYQPAYVVGRTMCGYQYCVVMSDGDIVAVTPSIWDSILYGMIIQSSGNSYHFVRSSSISTRKITTVSYSQYRSVKAVSVSAEASNEASGNTYNSGGSSYTSSPKYKASVAAVKSAAKSSSGTSGKYSPSKTSYTPSKTTYVPSKTSYSNNKVSYSSSKKGY